MAKVGIGEFGGCGLGGAKFAEGYEELVVDCANVIEGVANDGWSRLRPASSSLGLASSDLANCCLAP